jgi:uncharacterized protein YjbI with pentapeptide repeats
MKTHADTPLARLALAARPRRPWLRITASPWWTRVLLAAGARLRPPTEITSPPASPPRHTADPTSENLNEATTPATPSGRFRPHADLRLAFLPTEPLAGANLASANLTGAILTGAILTGANLAAANLTGANLAAANLAHAFLADANLTGATLIDANLAGATLIDANLTSADLAGAYLTGADLSGAKLVGVMWSERTQWPAGFASVMRERSERTADGLYRVRGSGSSDADLSAPLVPVS